MERPIHVEVKALGEGAIITTHATKRWGRSWPWLLPIMLLFGYQLGPAVFLTILVVLPIMIRHQIRVESRTMGARLDHVECVLRSELDMDEHDYHGVPEDIRSRVLVCIRDKAPDTRRSLEDYLRALWLLAQPHKDSTPTWADLGDWLTRAFEFKSSSRFPDLRRYTGPPESAELTPWQEFEETLLFHIADLGRMQGSVQTNEWRYLGSTSPTGNSWYNFDPGPYLQCALIGLSDHWDEQIRTPGWRQFAWFLELGRLHE